MANLFNLILSLLVNEESLKCFPHKYLLCLYNLDNDWSDVQSSLGKQYFAQTFALKSIFMYDNYLITSKIGLTSVYTQNLLTLKIHVWKEEEIYER